MVTSWSAKEGVEVVALFLIGVSAGIAGTTIFLMIGHHGSKRLLKLSKTFFRGWLGRIALASLLSAVLLIIGISVGVAFSQGARTLEPTRSALRATEALDRGLTTAVGDSRPVSASLQRIRADIDRIQRLPQPTGPAAGDTGRLLAELDQLEQRFWQQNQAYERAIFAMRQLVHAHRESLETIVSANGGWFDWTVVGGRDFAVWLGPTLLLTLLLVLAIAAALMDPKIRALIGRSGTFSLWGITITLESNESVRRTVGAAMERLDGEISNLYIRNLAGTKIGSAFSDVKGEIDRVFEQLGIRLRAIEHRATLYVPGFASHELIQATSYYGAGLDVSKEVVGRRFSVRYGMVGKSWRLRRPLYNPRVDNQADALIRDWGLTQGEATEQGQSSKQLIGLPIIERAGDVEPLGVIYLEADPSRALRPNDLGATPRFHGQNPPAIADDDAYAAFLWNEIKGHSTTKKLIAELKKLRTRLKWNDKVIDPVGR
ncbi:MAG TPA: hypothetical protein VGW40_13215 [Allosphingosinicella sp.]|nr:hypothetical protein [Allosphingosinicella sp.]